MSESGSPPTYVFDASAVLALTFDEPGAPIVQSHLPNGIIGVVNLAEVLAKLADRAVSGSMARVILGNLNLDLRHLTVQQAWRSTEMRELTRSAGLSLADRACLILAAELGLPVLTSDRSWSSISEAVGVPVTLIR